MESTARRTTGARTGGRSERVIKAVLDATLDELGEQGWAGFTIDGVVRRAGVSRTTVYRRWPSKSALLGAVVDSLRVRLVPPPSTSLQVDLRHVCTALGENLATPGERALARAFSLNDPELAEIARRSNREALQPMFDAFNRGIGRGEVGALDRPALLVPMLFSAVVELSLQDDRQPTADEIDSLVGIVIRSLQPASSLSPWLSSASSSSSAVTSATTKKAATTKRKSRAR